MCDFSEFSAQTKSVSEDIQQMILWNYSAVNSRVCELQRRERACFCFLTIVIIVLLPPFLHWSVVKRSSFLSSNGVVVSFKNAKFTDDTIVAPRFSPAFLIINPFAVFGPKGWRKKSPRFPTRPSRIAKSIPPPTPELFLKLPAPLEDKLLNFSYGQLMMYIARFSVLLWSRYSLGESSVPFTLFHHAKTFTFFHRVKANVPSS